MTDLQQAKLDLKEMKEEYKHQITGGWFCFFSDFSDGTAQQKIEKQKAWVDHCKENKGKYVSWREFCLKKSY